MAVLLVGTDFSTRSDRALRRAMLLARQAACELLLVHVIDDDQPQRMLNAQRGAAEELLADLRRTIADHDSIPCETAIRVGLAPDQLVAAARESGAGLMLIGPRRRAPLRDWIGGGTAERIVRESPIPLVAALAVPSAPYRHLLLPTDFGEASRRAAEAVRRMPFAASAAISFAHIHDPEALQMLGRAMVPAEERRRYLAESADRAHRELVAFIETLGWEEAKPMVRASGGSVAAEIVRAAADSGADLIVLSRSNKGLVEETLLGSVTEAVLRSGEVDVLIVPEG